MTDQRSMVVKYAFLVAISLVVAWFFGVTPPSPGRARVVMFDVGQGDSFLIESAQGTRLLIDGGADESVISELAKVIPSGDRRIDVVLATHPDADHIGGLPLVFSRYDVGIFLESAVYTDTDLFQELHRILHDKEIPAYIARRGMRIALDEQTSFSILFPDREVVFWETNTASVIGRVAIGDRSVLFTGDSPESIERFLSVATPREIRADILKLGHHGSKTSTSEIFLDAVKPFRALISAGRENRYGHPAPQVMERLQARGIIPISTIESGTVLLQTDGERWFEES